MEDDDDSGAGEGPSEGFFSFYDAKKEEEKAALAAAEVRRQTQEKLVSASALKEYQPPPQHVVENDGKTVLPALPTKPFKDSELPSTAGPSKTVTYDDDDEPVPVFTEATFIPGPEVI